MLYFIYVNLIILSSLFSVFLEKIRLNNYIFNTPIYGILFVFIIFFIFRDINLGSDYEGYIIHYNMLLSNEPSIIAKEQEYLYRFLENIFILLELQAWEYFSFLYLIVYYLILKGMPVNKYLMALGVLSLFVGGFFFFSLSAIRQIIAISIFFYSIRFIIKKQFLYYAICIIIASSFHLSAFFLIPFYFFNKFKYKNKLFLFIYIITLIPGVQIYFFNIIHSIVILVVENIYFFKPYIRYFDSTKLFFDNNVSFGIGFMIIQVINLFILLLANNVLKFKSELNIYYNFFATSCIVTNLFYNIELIIRLNTYFTISFLIVFPASIYLSRFKYKKIIISMILFLSVVLVQGRIYSMLLYLGD